MTRNIVVLPQPKAPMGRNEFAIGDLQIDVRQRLTLPVASFERSRDITDIARETCGAASDWAQLWDLASTAWLIAHPSNRSEEKALVRPVAAYRPDKPASMSSHAQRHE